MDTIGILGAGSMGNGIAQVAASVGHNVVICDNLTIALSKSGKNIQGTLKSLVDKGKMTDSSAYEMFSRIKFSDHMSDFKDCSMVIEAIVEDIEPKQIAFKSMEAIVSENTILASNTSSLSISAMGAQLKHPQRIIGVHFFNPAPLMRLVEIIPGLQTEPAVLERARKLIDGWGKT
ncbi:MAG: 3-hydroxyacyl-CoA dehydrogenase family protein, partial [Bacteroidota bacterium]